MRIATIGSLAAVSSSASLATQGLGLLPGEIIPVLLSSPDGLFAGSAQVQTSVDGTVWNNAGVAHTSVGAQIVSVTLQNFIRLNCTARTAGTVAAVGLNDIS